MKRAIIIFLSALALTACLDEFKIPSQNTIKKLVVEGGISNIDDEFFLRLSYTDEVGAIRRILPTSGIYAEIKSKSNERFVLRADPFGSGQFKPESGKISGKIGESYALFVSFADGRTFQSAWQQMKEPVEISELTSQTVKDPRAGYKINLTFKDPASPDNYYRWKSSGFYVRRSVGVRVGFGDNFCCNKCWVKEIDETIKILSDVNFNGNKIPDIPVFFSPYFGPEKHVIQVWQYSINKEAYQFFQKYKTQLNRTGSIFDPLPAGIKGNIVNVNDINDYALGFFEVSSVAKKQLVVLNEDLKKFNPNFDSPAYVPDGDCMLRYPYSFYVDERLPKF